MIKCIIVEDEFPAREELKYFLESDGSFKIEKEFENSLEALKYIETSTSEVIFLDINMPGLDGVTLGKILRKMNKNVKLIYTTAYKEFAVDAFEMDAFDYILKPYSEERIRAVLKKIKDGVSAESPEAKAYGNTNKKIAINTGEKILLIPTEEIIYIEANEKESTVVTIDRELITKTKISDLESLLPKENFFRCHRSYIVNLENIDEIEPWFNGGYILKTKYKTFSVPVSRTKVKELKSFFNIL